MIPTPERGVPPPPLKMSLSPAILLLKKGESLFFKGGNIDSIKSTLWQMKKKSPKRLHTCKKENGGVRVWRLS